MVVMEIRDVPTEVRDELEARAQSAGQSLQDYLLHLVTHHAHQPEPSQQEMTGGDTTTEKALAALARARAERDRSPDHIYPELSDSIFPW
ncbi:MAG: hypothetical protein Q4G45_08075 [Actinomycetia bacterium]|nr:hypothetical protein [Actinomycetes bacterium]